MKTWNVKCKLRECLDEAKAIEAIVVASGFPAWLDVRPYCWRCHRLQNINLEPAIKLSLLSSFYSVQKCHASFSGRKDISVLIQHWTFHNATMYVPIRQDVATVTIVAKLFWGTANCSVDWIWSMLHNRNFMPGTVNKILKTMPGEVVDPRVVVFSKWPSCQTVFLICMNISTHLWSSQLWSEEHLTLIPTTYCRKHIPIQSLEDK